ncbi:hypothetical protein [Dyella sp. 2HG41-7]|uniref:hypothetical protein n=1 Tax=Dyella sp. 2HG41-7 TaxID=2883239 RepID=UPI001F308DD4|nr:hypothetical protein [Dyella sp. 2HG41-7]
MHKTQTYLEALTAWEHGERAYPPVYPDLNALPVDYLAPRLIGALRKRQVRFLRENGMPSKEAFDLAGELYPDNPVLLAMAARDQADRYRIVREHVHQTDASAYDLEQIDKLNKWPVSFGLGVYVGGVQ